jgi:glutamate racemase
MADDRPIGIFDSGVGGLTVARAIIGLLPHETLLYVGDSAHFPYGPKPVEEIRRYAMDIAGYLVGRGVKMLVVACNSIEVSAIGDIAASHGVPVLGVINPGARAAIRATRNGTIGVIGTRRRRPSVRTSARSARRRRSHGAPCSSSTERGDDVRGSARRACYSRRWGGHRHPDPGCTHYPRSRGSPARERRRRPRVLGGGGAKT